LVLFTEGQAYWICIDLLHLLQERTSRTAGFWEGERTFVYSTLISNL